MWSESPAVLNTLRILALQFDSQCLIAIGATNPCRKATKLSDHYVRSQFLA
jgi:hypothetical protein